MWGGKKLVQFGIQSGWTGGLKERELTCSDASLPWARFNFLPRSVTSAINTSFIFSPTEFKGSCIKRNIYRYIKLVYMYYWSNLWRYIHCICIIQHDRSTLRSLEINPELEKQVLGGWEKKNCLAIKCLAPELRSVEPGVKLRVFMWDILCVYVCSCHDMSNEWWYFSSVKLKKFK